MEELKLKKENAIQLLNSKLKNGNELLEKITEITSQSNFNDMLDEHEHWGKSVGVLLNRIFVDKNISKNFLSWSDGGIIVEIDNMPTLAQQKSSLMRDIKNDCSKIQEVIKVLNENKHNSSNNSKLTYDGIIKDLKNNKYTAVIGVIFLISVPIIYFLTIFIDFK